MLKHLKHIVSLSITAPVVGVLIVIIAFINNPPWRLTLWALLACTIAVFTWIATGPAKRLWAVFFVFTVLASILGFTRRNFPKFFARLEQETAQINSPGKVDCARAPRFGNDPDGKRIAIMHVWYPSDFSQFECFNTAGWHPARGTRLIAIDDAIAEKLDAWLARPTPTPAQATTSNIEARPAPEPTGQATPEATPPAVSSPTPRLVSTAIQQPTPDDGIQLWATPRPRPTQTLQEPPREPDQEPIALAAPMPSRIVPQNTVLSLRVTQDIDLLDVLPRPISPIETRLTTSVRDVQGNELANTDTVFEIGVREYNQIREKVVRVWFGIYDKFNAKDERRNFRIVPTDQNDFLDFELKKKGQLVRSLKNILIKPRDPESRPQYEMTLKKDTVINFRIVQPWNIAVQ